MTERPEEERRREELRERAEELGWESSSELSDREIEERIAETERRRDQLQEAWRRRHTLSGPEENRPDGRRKA